jgi:hypothetical protein
MARNRYVKIHLKDIVGSKHPDLTGATVVGHGRTGDGSWLLLERPEAAKRTRGASSKPRVARSAPAATVAPSAATSFPGVSNG